MKLSKATIILIIFCSIGLLFQVTEVTKSYLEYKIRRIIIRNFPFSLDPAAISICFNLNVFIPTEVVDTLSNDNESSWEKFYNFINVTPMKELFKIMPKVDETLMENGCAIRFPSRYTMSFLNRTQCYGHFTIQRYIQRQFMCFKFSPIFGSDISKKFETRFRPGDGNHEQKFGRGWVMEYLMAPVETGVMYALYLNESLFRGARRVVAYAHGQDTDHYEDSFITTQYPMTINDHRGTAIKISFQQLSFHRLEAPYPSKCYKMANGRSMTHKFADVLNEESIKRFNKSCAVTQLFENQGYMNQTIISDQDFKNETFLNEFNQIIQRNEKYRTGWTCDLNFYLTVPVTQSIEVLNGSRYKFLVYLTWPQLHSVDVNDESLQTILDLLTYIASSLGFWFGFSLFSTLLKSGTGLVTIYKLRTGRREKVDDAKSGQRDKSGNNINIGKMYKIINNQTRLIEILKEDCKNNKIYIRSILSRENRIESRLNQLFMNIPID